MQSMMRIALKKCVISASDPEGALFKVTAAIVLHEPCPVLTFSTSPDAGLMAQARAELRQRFGSGRACCRIGWLRRHCCARCCRTSDGRPRSGWPKRRWRVANAAIAELSETLPAHFDRLTDEVERGVRALTELAAAAFDGLGEKQVGEVGRAPFQRTGIGHEVSDLLHLRRLQREVSTRCGKCRQHVGCRILVAARLEIEGGCVGGVAVDPVGGLVERREGRAPGERIFGTEPRLGVNRGWGRSSVPRIA